MVSIRRRTDPYRASIRDRRHHSNQHVVLRHNPAVTVTADVPDWTALRTTWPNAEASRFVEAAGVRWHVQVAGTGPAILLLHGTGGASHSWGEVLPLLARDHTVVVPDLPGQGFTPALPEPPTIHAMARAVHALCARLSLGPVAAAGHSAGVAILLAMAQERLLPLEAVAGFGAALVAPPELYRRLIAPLLRPLVTASATVSLVASLAARPGVSDRLLAGTGSTVCKAQRERYRALFASRAHVAGALAWMAHWDLASLLRPLAGAALVPVTLVHGTRDRFVPVTALRRVAASLPTATVVTWEGAGHLLHEERPAEAADTIRQVLSGARSAVGRFAPV